MPAAAAAAGDYAVDLPQRSDAAAIVRCFLAVYGHHYVHSEVFSPHRYWDKVESGELVPAVVRDGAGEVIGHVALEREPGARGRRTRRGGCAVGLPRPPSARAHDRAPLAGSAQARPLRNLRRAAHHPHLLAAQRRARRHAGLRGAARRESRELPAQGSPLSHRRSAPELSAHLPFCVQKPPARAQFTRPHPVARSCSSSTRTSA